MTSRTGFSLILYCEFCQHAHVHAIEHTLYWINFTKWNL